MANSHSGGSTKDLSATEYNVSRLFKFVKTYYENKAAQQVRDTKNPNRRCFELVNNKENGSPEDGTADNYISGSPSKTTVYDDNISNPDQGVNTQNQKSTSYRA
ncbi:MAG: hypothetical protein IJT23_02460 [Clostridia bacterium]|nr:hypothetical protein [Clostridia bacterium]